MSTPVYAYFTLPVKISYCLVHCVALQASERSIEQPCQVLPPFVHIPCIAVMPHTNLRGDQWAQPRCLPAPFAQICVISRLFGSVPPLRFVPNGDHERREEQVAQILAARSWKVVVLSCWESYHFQGLSSFCCSLAQSNKRGAGSCVIVWRTNKQQLLPAFCILERCCHVVIAKLCPLWVMKRQATGWMVRRMSVVWQMYCPVLDSWRNLVIYVCGHEYHGPYQLG
jgi:hypothetical protein